MISIVSGIPVLHPRLHSQLTLIYFRQLVVPSEDSHQSEYIAPCDARRAFLSGFNGSAGTAVVTPSHAILATDGRYFNQAEHQLDSNWELLKQGVQGSITWFDWYVFASPFINILHLSRIQSKMLTFRAGC